MKENKNIHAMAKIYVQCSSIEEFLIQANLQGLDYASRWKWNNPFVIYHIVSTSNIMKIAIYVIIPLLICATVFFY